MITQKTLEKSISCRGVGVHSGKQVSLTIKPAPIGFGIQFKRLDLPTEESLIPAAWNQVTETAFCTKIENQFGHALSTIEHLMAALCATNITNALIEVSGPEVPIMDGSAAPFLFLIECAGIKDQKTAQDSIYILKPVRVETDYGFAALSPSDNLEVHLELSFPKRKKKAEYYSCTSIAECFKEEIARARTFGFYSDVDKLKKAGLARGGSLDNAVVFKDGNALNPGGLRYTDECVRHKVLDIIGDLYLARLPIVGKFTGKNSGHGMNNRLLRKLLEDPTSWSLSEPQLDLSIKRA